jgi:sporulation protein YqfC
MRAAAATCPLRERGQAIRRAPPHKYTIGLFAKRKKTEKGGGRVMSKRNNLLRRASDLLDLPLEALAGLPQVELSGTSRLRIENHGGVTEYGSEAIRVAGGGCAILVTGTTLEIRAMTASTLLITGEIQSIQLTGNS